MCDKNVLGANSGRFRLWMIVGISEHFRVFHPRVVPGTVLGIVNFLSTYLIDVAIFGGVLGTVAVVVAQHCFKACSIKVPSEK
jgi:hypothetical protein